MMCGCHFFSSYLGGIYGGFATLTAVLMTIHSTYNIQQNEVKRANDMKRLEVQPIIELKKSVSSGFRNSKEHLTNSLEFTIVNIGFNIGKDVTIGIQSDLGFENDRFSYEFIQPLEKFNFKAKFIEQIATKDLFGDYWMSVKICYNDIYNNKYESEYKMKYHILRTENGHVTCNTESPEKQY